MKTTAMTTAVDHDRDLLHHADGGDDRVEREHDVEQHDLDQMTPAKLAAPAWDRVSLFSLELVVDLVRALGEQEQAADDEDQVAAGDAVTEAP